MNNSLIEEKRNKLNLDIRGILAIIDLIDGKEKEYEDYITIVEEKEEVNETILENSLDENGFLDQQIKLVEEVKERLINIFKD